MSTSTLVKINNCRIGYKKRTLIDNVTFDINKGDFIVINGHNGSGKSTLLKYITMQSHSKNVKHKNDIKISYVPQQLYFEETVMKLLEDYSFVFGSSVDKEEIIKSFDLGLLLDKRYSELSTGEKQRVILSISFLNKPDLIVLDEFSKGLDISVKQKVIDLLINIKNKNKDISFVIVSHDSFVEKLTKEANKIFVIKNNKLEVSND